MISNRTTHLKFGGKFEFLNFLQDPVWRQTGSELRVLADAFAASPGRLRVRQRAEQVDVGTLDMEKFWALLRSLFENGQITRERILVLFFFCSDVAILAIRQKASQLVSQLTQWSLQFIRNQVIFEKPLSKKC